jgi:hypothetical protein
MILNCYCKYCLATVKRQETPLEILLNGYMQLYNIVRSVYRYADLNQRYSVVQYLYFLKKLGNLVEA